MYLCPLSVSQPTSIVTTLAMQSAHCFFLASSQAIPCHAMPGSLHPRLLSYDIIIPHLFVRCRFNAQAAIQSHSIPFHPILVFILIPYQWLCQQTFFNYANVGLPSSFCPPGIVVIEAMVGGLKAGLKFIQTSIMGPAYGHKYVHMGVGGHQ